MRISMASLYVDDQARAAAFYTEKLGFVISRDDAYGDERWLTVAEPGGGTELLLSRAEGASAEFQRHQRWAGKPAIVFATDDVHADHERLRGLGVEFTLAPTVLPYGGTDAVLDDTCGNLVCLHQT